MDGVVEFCFEYFVSPLAYDLGHEDIYEIVVVFYFETFSI
jgi:hypothetical protein